MNTFFYNSPGRNVIFGTDTIRNLPEEIDKLQCKRSLIICTPEQRAHAEMLKALSGKLAVGIFDQAAMHTPVEVTTEALRLVDADRIDCLVAIGGGSAIGLGKALAYRTNLPQIVIPTTYAGSEMTAILGQTENGQKTTLKDARVLPEVVLYDVRLTLSLPPHFSGVSGLNAIAHAVEALYAKDRNASTTAMASEGIVYLARALPQIVIDPHDIDARADALAGAALCGQCLADVGMALHHKLCHTLGGSFGLPHAETHAAVLPHAVAYNASADPAAMDTIAKAIGKDDAATGLYKLGVSVQAEMALRRLGLQEEDLDRAADLAVQNPYWNPREIERDAIRSMLQRAWAGAIPV